jgi:hypothetical protein
MQVVTGRKRIMVLLSFRAAHSAAVRAVKALRCIKREENINNARPPPKAETVKNPNLVA